MSERTPNQADSADRLPASPPETMIASTAIHELLAWSEKGAIEPLLMTLALNGRDLQLRLTDQLRVLPGRRLVCGGTLLDSQAEDQEIVIKWFFGDAAQRYADRECRGVAALLGADMPTPALLASFRVESVTSLHASGVATLAASALVFERLPDVQPVNDALLAHRPDLWARLWGLLAGLHEAGVSHSDLHFGNLLYDPSSESSHLAQRAAVEPLWLIDGDGVRQSSAQALPLATCVAAFAELAAQAQQHFSIEALSDHWAVYAAAREWAAGHSGLQALERRYVAARRARIEHFQAKTQRSCTAFAKRRTILGTALVDCGWLSELPTSSVAGKGDDLRELLVWLDALPDLMCTQSAPLKAGNTATVVRATWRDQALVIKRYNNKSWWHRLRRLVRPNRGLNSWVFAHTLRFMGIPTARAVALLRTRFGGPTYLVMQDCPGAELNAAQLEVNESLCQRLVMLLDRLGAEGLVHNDTKASNFLWDKTTDALALIDLDAMQMPASLKAQLSGQQRDRRRLLRNFAETPELQRRFRSALGL